MRKARIERGTNRRNFPLRDLFWFSRCINHTQRCLLTGGTVSCTSCPQCRGACRISCAVCEFNSCLIIYQQHSSRLLRPLHDMTATKIWYILLINHNQVLVAACNLWILSVIAQLISGCMQLQLVRGNFLRVLSSVLPSLRGHCKN